MRDPRGPVRVIVAIDKSDFNKAGVKLSCNHVPDLNPVFSRRVGDECRCFQCGKEEKTP